MKWVSRQGSRSLKVANTYITREATSMIRIQIIMQPVQEHMCSEAVSWSKCLSCAMCILVVSRYNGLMVHTFTILLQGSLAKRSMGRSYHCNAVDTDRTLPGGECQWRATERNALLELWVHVCTYLVLLYTNGACIYTCHCFTMYIHLYWGGM